MAIEPNTQRKRVAAVVTEYHRNSHADVIVTKLLAGYEINGRSCAPRLQVASLYVDQFTERDLSREMSARYGVPIYASIADALTLGGPSLAVDGVVLVGEHGNYPYNELGQHLYPRHRFFMEAAAVIERSGRSIPVFSDKHLSVSWTEAEEMYNKAKTLGLAFTAGSSLPLTWRRPPLELPVGCEVSEALVIGYGGVEAYGFHALETLQCMVERRAQGETGVAAVRCIRGDEVWEGAAAGLWSPDLQQAAQAVLVEKQPGDPREHVKDPVAFLIEYCDGLRATVLMLNGWCREFSFAARVAGQADPVASLFWLESQAPYNHFSFLVREIEEMVLTGRPTYPVERTLLTTGVLAAAMQSRFEGGRRLVTPHLSIHYQPPRAPLGAMAAV